MKITVCYEKLRINTKILKDQFKGMKFFQQ